MAIIGYDSILSYMLLLTYFVSLSHRSQLFSYRDIYYLYYLCRLYGLYSYIFEYLINALLFYIT